MKQFLKTACMGKGSLTKEACIGIFEEDSSSRAFLESLDFNSWNITSYNPIKREICIVIYAKNNLNKIISTQNISLKIPTV